MTNTDWPYPYSSLSHKFNKCSVLWNCAQNCSEHDRTDKYYRIIISGYVQYVPFGQWGMDGLSVSSLSCSCLLTSLPRDSWEQLQEPQRQAREGSLGHRPRLTAQIFSPFSISSVSLLCCHFVSLYKSQPSPELTHWKTLECSQTLKHREQTAIINVFQRLERAPSQQGLAFLVFVSHTHRHICTSYNGP